MNNNFKNVMGEIMFPSTFKCVCCGNEIATENMLICDKCYKALPFITGKTCDVCGEPIRSDSKLCLNCKRERPKFTKAFSLLKYEPPVSNLIKNLKYDGATYLTSTLSAFIMKCYLLNKIEADVVIPVPIHYERYKERGFNQSELLCYHLKHSLGLNVNEKALVRRVHTSTQTKLTRSERLKNLNNAFVVVNKNAIKGKVVLLVDDVYTTGSTLNECAKTLLKANAAKVYAITVAHNEIETKPFQI